MAGADWDKIKGNVLAAEDPLAKADRLLSGSAAKGGLSRLWSIEPSAEDRALANLGSIGRAQIERNEAADRWGVIADTFEPNGNG